MGICDYFDKDNVIDNNDNDVFVSKSVISFNTKVIKSGGDMQMFVAKFFDGHGNEAPNIVPRWNVICDFSDALQIEQCDDYIKIGIDDDAYIDEDFKLLLSDDRGNYMSSIIIEVESLL